MRDDEERTLCFSAVWIRMKSLRRGSSELVGSSKIGFLAGRRVHALDKIRWLLSPETHLPEARHRLVAVRQLSVLVNGASRAPRTTASSSRSRKYRMSLRDRRVHQAGFLRNICHSFLPLVLPELLHRYAVYEIPACIGARRFKQDLKPAVGLACTGRTDTQLLTTAEPRKLYRTAPADLAGMQTTRPQNVNCPQLGHR